MSGCMRKNIIMYQADVDRLEEIKKVHGIPYSVAVRMALEAFHEKLKNKEKR